MRTSHRLQALLLVPCSTLSALLLAGCSGDGYLTLDAEDDNLPHCTTTSSLDVEDLNTAAMPTCKSLGSSLTFPSKVKVTLDEGAGGVESSTDPVVYSWIDVGNFGFVAGQATKACRKHQVWGRSDAVKLVKAAFGQDWPCT